MTLKHQMTTEILRFKSQIEQFPWSSKPAYADWLSQTYYFASETTTLLSLAAAHTEKNSKLQLRFIEHASEEKGHDKLLLMDLKTISSSLEQNSELPATSSLYQPQFFWLQQRDPHAFFGYIILLEGLAASHGRVMNELALEAHGRSATHFLRVHAADDVEHVERAMNEVSDFSTDVAKSVLQNFMHAASCYEWLLNSIKERRDQKRASAA